MSNVGAVLLGTLMVVISVTILYWNIIRPVFLKALLFRMFAKRDALRRMAIDGSISVESVEYKYLQDFLCKSIAIVPMFSLVHFSYFAMRGKSSTVVAEFDSKASETLQKFKHDIAEDAVAILMINSPILTAIALAVIPFFWVVGKIRSMKVLQKAEQFVNTLSYDTNLATA